MCVSVVYVSSNYCIIVLAGNWQGRTETPAGNCSGRTETPAGNWPSPTETPAGNWLSTCEQPTQHSDWQEQTAALISHHPLLLTVMWSPARDTDRKFSSVWCLSFPSSPSWCQTRTASWWFLSWPRLHMYRSSAATRGPRSSSTASTSRIGVFTRAQALRVQ